MSSSCLRTVGLIKDAVQRTQKRSVFIKVLTPESRILVASEDHVEIAFLVVRSSSYIFSKSGVMSTKKLFRFAAMICSRTESFTLRKL